MPAWTDYTPDSFAEQIAGWGHPPSHAAKLLRTFYNQAGRIELDYREVGRGLLEKLNAETVFRQSHVMHDARESGLELYPIVAENEPLGRGRRQIEHHLAVLHVGTRNFDTGFFRVDDDVRRFAVVHHPGMHRANQVRTLRIARSIIHAWRISRSFSERLARNVGREKIVLAYFMIDCACGGTSIS
jgi:hypothetical protein